MVMKDRRQSTWQPMAATSRFARGEVVEPVVGVGEGGMSESGMPEDCMICHW